MVAPQKMFTGGKAGFFIRFEGFEDLQKRIEAMPAKIVASVFRKALRSAANKAATQLRKGTPKLSGDARRAIKVKVKVRKGVAWARVYYKGKPSFYMRIYEFGAVRSQRQFPNPYFDKATRRVRREAEENIAKALRRAVERAEAA